PHGSRHLDYGHGFKTQACEFEIFSTCWLPLTCGSHGFDRFYCKSDPLHISDWTGHLFSDWIGW
ncbi:hypothetical protein PIB30_094883, partial [Stylosanthes scabra]|nr:hypothetical protein [Stylosanthes scabra]